MSKPKSRPIKMEHWFGDNLTSAIRKEIEQHKKFIVFDEKKHKNGAYGYYYRIGHRGRIGVKVAWGFASKRGVQKEAKLLWWFRDSGMTPQVYALGSAQNTEYSPGNSDAYERPRLYIIFMQHIYGEHPKSADTDTIIRRISEFECHYDLDLHDVHEENLIARYIRPKGKQRRRLQSLFLLDMSHDLVKPTDPNLLRYLRKLSWKP